MNISYFFRNRLNAPLRHTIQSWGAVNSFTSDIFLRIGEWAVNDYDDGNTWVTLLHPEWVVTKHGPSQRIDHIKQMANGATAYATVLKFSSKGKIQSFDDQFLLKLGKPKEEDGFVFAKVVSKISVDDFLAHSSNLGNTTEEIVTISRSAKTRTERETLVSARLGQGLFRSQVLRLWHYRCAVTGSTTSLAIRASHIKPWKVSTNAQRLDPYNGIPLVATFDALFDAGMITFLNNGKIKISKRLSSLERKNLGITNGNGIGRVHSKTKKYLEYHKSNVFLAE